MFLGDQDQLTESYFCSTAYHGSTMPALHWITTDAMWDQRGALAGMRGRTSWLVKCNADSTDFL